MTVPASGPSGAAAGPVRTCIGCRRRAAQAELLRIALDGDGRLAVGRTLPGRGAYLCRDRPACAASAAKRNAFRRALRRPLGSEAVQAFLQHVQAFLSQ